MPHVVQTAGSMFSVFFTDRRRSRDYDGAARAGDRSATPRSSTRCSTAASTCRRRRSRRGSSPPPTTTRALDRVARRPARTPPAPPRPRTAPRGADPMTDDHGRPPAAARRGAQPRGGPLRPAARLPPLRPRPGRWPSASPSALGDRGHHPPAWPRRWSGPRRRRAPIADALGLPVATDDRLIEAANVFQGQTFGVGDGSLRQPAHWKHLCNPFRPSWGEPYVRDRRADARRGRTTPATPPAATRR